MCECADSSKDVADIEPIPFSLHVRLVHQPPHERGYYCELQQHVSATDFVLNATQFPGGDQNMQITELAGCGPDGRVALLHRASHFTILHDKHSASQNEPKDTRQACRIICNLREREFEALLIDCLKLFDRAVWLHHGQHSQGRSIFKDFLQNLQENHCGDLEVALKLCEQANIAIREYHPENWKQIYRTSGLPEGDRAMAKALRECIRRLTVLCAELVNRKRALRFSAMIYRIQLVFEDESQSLTCERCNTPNLLPSDSFVLSNCGHLLCSPCAEASDAQCPVHGCASQYEAYQKVQASELTGHPGSDGYYPNGKKLHEITDLITEIPSDDRVLLFVQHRKFLAKIEQALTDASIKFVSPKGPALSNALIKFQRKSDDKVLVLNIGDVSASGR
jgi:hypothetical protein